MNANTDCLPGAYMACDIVSRVIKPGMMRHEVVALLGRRSNEAKKLAYSLGQCVHDGGDALEISFNETGEVVRVEIH